VTHQTMDTRRNSWAGTEAPLATAIPSLQYTHQYFFLSGLEAQRGEGVSIERGGGGSETEEQVRTGENITYVLTGVCSEVKGH